MLLYTGHPYDELRTKIFLFLESWGIHNILSTCSDLPNRGKSLSRFLQCQMPRNGLVQFLPGCNIL